MYKLGFIGLGNMASAIQEGMIASGFIKGEEICGFDLSDTALNSAHKRGVKTLKDGNEVVRNSEIIFMAVKPQVVLSLIHI